MDKDQFWQIIDDAREKAEVWQDMYEPLFEALSKLDAPEIIRWQQIFDEYQELSYKQKLWAAAAVMLGGCSDDSFDYFRGWLTAQGKDVFMNALADPESLASVKAVKAFGRETRASFYTPLKGHYEAARFESMLSVAPAAYERKTGGDLYSAMGKHPLSEQEKADIAGGIVYAEDIDVKWGGLGAKWIETDAVLKEMLPRLHALFNGDIAPAADNYTFSIVEKVCANMPDGRHMLIIQASCDNTRETVWAIGDDQVCAVTSADCIRNPIPYNSVLIQEFPYQDHSPQSVGKLRTLIEALVELTADRYLKYDGIFHIYPQWLPEEAYAHLGKELFEQMAEGCDHIILRDNHMMEFVPRKANAAERQKPGEVDTINKWDTPVDVVCDEMLTTFPTRRIARDFFFEGMCGTDGSERERYTAIFLNLEETDRKMVHDGEPGEENPRIRSIGRFKGDHIGDRQWLDKPTTYKSYMDSQNSVIAKIRGAKVTAKSKPPSVPEQRTEKSRSGEER